MPLHVLVNRTCLYTQNNLRFFMLYYSGLCSMFKYIKKCGWFGSQMSVTVKCCELPQTLQAYLQILAMPLDVIASCSSCPWSSHVSAGRRSESTTSCPDCRADDVFMLHLDCPVSTYHTCLPPANPSITGVNFL